ncbi:hypothetical protein B0T14DRAFT_560419 [Immersiella caudata]|uniref:Chromo domain-containing protein n=1 Tax=Immersiella caudata TaxID=314043 RepID=A0AA39XF13_9PEZI|nr:hypothetical protein B0T14DRAFT_560419 [Immersiella caudata]
MANKKQLRGRKVEIEVSISSVKKYVGGSGPPMQKLYLVPPRDSTAYIVSRHILPPLKDTTPDTRRLPYYLIGWTDEPVAKLLIPCNRALEYVSPAEIEQWEAADYERRLKEKEKEAATAKKVGRPRKKPQSPSLEVAVPDDALELAKRVGGPSLSTPQKRRHRDLDEDAGESSNLDAGNSSHGESDEAAIQRQILAEDGVAEDDAGYPDDTDQDSVDQPHLPAPSTAPFRSAKLAQDSSRASNSTPGPSDGPPAASRNKPITTTSVIPHRPPTIPMIHPAFLQNPQPKKTPKYPLSKSKPAKTPVQQTSTTTKGFTPIASSKPQRVLSQPSTPASGSGVLSDASIKRKRESSKKSPVGQPKEKRVKPENGKRKGKKRADSEEPDPNLFADNDVWVVKELLDDRYVYQKGVKVHYYLVSWEGNWPPDQNPTWEPAENIQDDNLIAEYRRRKKAGLLKPDKSQTTLLSYLTTPQYSNVAEAFEGDIHDQEKPVTTGIESDSDESDEEGLLVTEGKHIDGQDRA